MKNGGGNERTREREMKKVRDGEKKLLERKNE